MAKGFGWESKTYSNISADTAAFILRGGQYAVTSKATWGGGSVTLQRLSADGSTYVGCMDAMTADSYDTANLPPGTYKFDVVTATAVYLDVSSVVIAA